MSQMEQWAAVPGLEGAYEVSDQGRVRSLDRTRVTVRGEARFYRGCEMRPALNSRGRRTVMMAGKSRLIAPVILEAFVGPRPEGMECCHSDGDRTNDRLSNLRWDTPLANVQDRVAHGAYPNTRKTHCSRGHEFLPENLCQSRLARGERRCVACRRALRTNHYARAHGTTVDVDELANRHYAAILADRSADTEAAR